MGERSRHLELVCVLRGARDGWVVGAAGGCPNRWRQNACCVCVRELWQCSEALRQLRLQHLMVVYLHKGGWMWRNSRQRDLRAVRWCTTGTGVVLCVCWL